MSPRAATPGPAFSRAQLARLGRSILAKIEAGVTTSLPASLAVFVDGLALLDKRAAVAVKPPKKFNTSELAQISKLVGIEVRNTLEGDSPRVVSALPPVSTLIEALEERLVIVARDDFNVFVEMVASATGKGPNGKRRVVPMVQAAIHRRWTKIVDDETVRRVLIIAHNECGKSQQLAILRPLFDLGRDPTLKMVILCNVAAGAIARIRAISDLILFNGTVGKIFPHLKPNPDGPWNTTQLRVVRGTNDKEPSIEAFGLKGAILGSRVDRVYADDLLDSENTSTLAGINDLVSWWNANVETRLTEDARVILVGTPWRPDDLLHVLERNTEDYKAHRFPILDTAGKCTWPQAWTPERIAQRRRTLGDLEFARSMMCVARSDDASAFKEAHIRAAIAAGEGHPRIHSLADFPRGEAPEGSIIVVGVDLAASQKKRADSSAISTLMVERDGRHTTLSIEAGKWAPNELIERLHDHRDRYDPKVIAVESNGSQVFFVQQARAAGLPIREFTTGRNKHDLSSGVEAQATVFENGLWVIPSHGGQTTPEVQRWIHGLLFYDKHAHTDDTVMSMWIAYATAKQERRANRTPEVRMLVVGDGSYAREERRLAREKAEREAARLQRFSSDGERAPGSLGTANRPNTFATLAVDEPTDLERLFDVRPSRNGASERDAREAARDARHTSGEGSRGAERSVRRLLDGTIGNDNVTDEREPGDWRSGGWRGGRLL